MYTNNELMFPRYVIPVIRDMRGEEWQRLVDEAADMPDNHPKLLAFVLMMIRLNGCMDCETDSYRAMRGCAMCATQTLRRYKGSDQELIEAYAQALDDVEEFLKEQAEEDEATGWRVA
jgi:hypothetical protein